MKEINLNGKTPDIAEENIQKLKQIFPDVFTEDKVDFEKLQQVLGNYVEDSNERYNFTWNGKGRALRLSQTPSLGTLRPCKEESKDWDNTQNLYIEGDNLEVLKLLQKSYHSKVKMIYLDPPYNTGKDFVYKDDFHDSLENYKRITGQVDSEGNRVSTNTETSGRYHTDWLNMMYPRLRLARNLLSDDGVIFISIDDNEVDNLKKICNEVFGEDNFSGQFIWKKKQGGGNDSNVLVVEHEYIVSYSKTLLNFKFYLDTNYELDNALYPFKDEIGEYGLVTLDKSSIRFSDTLVFEIKDSTGKIYYPRIIKGTQSCWRWSKKKVEEEFSSLVFKNDKVYTKYYRPEGITPKSLLIAPIYGRTETGNDDIKKIFENSNPFSYPKPLSLMNHFLMIGSKGNDIILDFFSGSSTTAHSVMQLNAEDGGNRKFIMVQLPEQTDEKDEAYKAGYMNICEIGKERIRRAGEKIKEENKEKENIENLDIGFKVLKLDTSNIRKWLPDHDNLEQSLLDYVDNYMEGRTELDVVYEIMLKYGLDLTYSVDEIVIADKKVYSIGFGMLMICLDDEITTEVARGILAKSKELSPESTRVVFKDNGFKTDSNKTNIKEILKAGGIEEFITI